MYNQPYCFVIFLVSIIERESVTLSNVNQNQKVWAILKESFTKKISLQITIKHFVFPKNICIENLLIWTCFINTDTNVYANKKFFNIIPDNSLHYDRKWLFNFFVFHLPWFDINGMKRCKIYVTFCHT